MSNWPSNFSNIVVVLVFECRHGLAGDLANQPSNVDVSPKLGASVETFITFSENFNQSLERTTFPQAAANIVNFMRCNLQLLRIGLLHLLPCASSLYVYVYVYYTYTYVCWLGLRTETDTETQCFRVFVFHDGGAGGESWCRL